LKPSKKCSQSIIVSLPAATEASTVSRKFLRFSSGETPSVSSTCLDEVLATKQAAGATLLRIACTPGSLPTERPERFVIPNAVKVARVVRGSAKNASSTTLAPG
jgi:hypothetical protein